MGSAVTRGILIGGSFGVFAVLLGVSDNMLRSVGLGMVAGFLAGLTMSWRSGRKKE